MDAKFFLVASTLVNALQSIGLVVIFLFVVPHIYKVIRQNSRDIASHLETHTVDRMNRHKEAQIKSTKRHQ